MKVTEMSVDYSDTMYQMIKYLMTYPQARQHVDCVDARRGGFMLGRATGHTTTLLSTASRLAYERYNVLVVTPTHHHTDYLIRQYGWDKPPLFKVVAIDAVRNKFPFGCRADEYDVVIFENAHWIDDKRINDAINELEHRQSRLPVYFEVQ